MADLPDNARRALERAHAEPLSYAVRLVRAPDGRLVAILGEAHMKLAKASAIGKAVVSAFELRGVETFQKKQITWGRALGVVIHAPRALLRALSFGAIKDSTITDAKQLPSGYTVELERAKKMPLGLHVTAVYMTSYFVFSFLSVLAPLFAPIAPALSAAILFVTVLFQVHLLALIPGFLVRRKTWSWVVHPFLGILALRDELMSEGTVRMLEDHPSMREAVVVMGRAHVTGYEARLVEQYKYTRVPFP
ncbi:MAG: hypothetical protein JWP87_4860 [Labilithrix sp.]|nr:hypothetical protein [Labilithrix sp.]